MRGTKACGSFNCDKDGTFELLVHMEADPLVASYGGFNFETVLPCGEAAALDEVAAFSLNHQAGLFVVCSVSPNIERSAGFRSAWQHADFKLAQRGTWLFSTTAEKLRREPKWTRARELARCAGVYVDRRDEERVVDYLTQVHHAPMRTCASLCINGADSLDALYKLISAGVVFLGSEDDVLPSGSVTLHPPELAFDRLAIGWLQEPSGALVSRTAGFLPRLAP
ncbi:hypothetical protein ACQKLX_21200 [Bosea sp. NPDC003192]|uniref:hypothetical protein n=1 Tax=Bosea sp. NPDC003192 TaxID=3390551 RepID=UPI003CFE5AE6